MRPFIFIWLWASRRCQRFALFLLYHFHLCSAHCKLQAEIVFEWVDCMRNKTISMLLIFVLKFFHHSLFIALCIEMYGRRLCYAYGRCHATPNRSKLVRTSNRNANNSFGCWFFFLQCWKMLYEQILTNWARFLNPILPRRSTWLSTSISQQAFVAWILFLFTLSCRLSPITNSSGSLVCSEHAHSRNLSMFSFVCVHFVCAQCCWPSRTHTVHGIRINSDYCQDLAQNTHMQNAKQNNNHGI